jgi:hypothetical protein
MSGLWPLANTSLPSHLSSPTVLPSPHLFVTLEEARLAESNSSLIDDPAIGVTNPYSSDIHRDAGLHGIRV